MANIVVAMHNFLLRQDDLTACPPFYQSFVEGLKNSGNNVLCFQSNFCTTINLEEIPTKYLEKIKKFKPDLFVFFNNQFWDITKHFKEPILIFDVDSPNHYCNLDIIKKNLDRFKFIVTQTSGIQVICDVIGCHESDVRYLMPFTGIKAKNMEQNINVSFLGSHWCWNDFDDIIRFIKMEPNRQDRETAKKALEAFIDYPFVGMEEVYHRNGLTAEKILHFDNLVVARARLSGVRRLRYLTAIADLGLEIRGQSWINSNMLLLFSEVVLSYSFEPVNHILQVEDFLNSSKIGFNTKHIQAKSGFSWRVADILASNACLVSEYAKDLVDLGFKVPMFESPAEAREQCLKLLKNENMRKDIVAHSQDIINKRHRFKHILPVIEDFVGMKLHDNKEGSLEVIPIFNQGNEKQEKVLPPFPNVSKSGLTIKSKIYRKLAKHFYKKIKYKGTNDVQ